MFSSCFFIFDYCLQLIGSRILPRPNDAVVLQTFQSVIPLHDFSCLSSGFRLVDQRVKWSSRCQSFKSRGRAWSGIGSRLLALFYPEEILLVDPFLHSYLAPQMSTLACSVLGNGTVFRKVLFPQSSQKSLTFKLDAASLYLKLGALCEIRRWNSRCPCPLGSGFVDGKTNLGFWLWQNNMTLLGFISAFPFLCST